MDNLEINLAIAKIECVVIEHIINTDKAIMVCSEDVEQEYKLYNPLTDDALCFQLMVKYNVILISVNESYGTGPIIGYNAFYKQLTDKIYLNEVNPNKAILLAIIAAHKD